MASHKGWDRHFPVNSVKASGGSFNLAKGQLGLINLEAVPTVDGLKVINSVAGLPKTSRFQLRVGKTDINNNRSQSSKDWSTETFKLENIVALEVDAPKSGIGVDEFILGYDGFDAATAIDLAQGVNEEIGVTLSGEVIGAIGYKDAAVELKVYLEAPNTGTYTNQEIVEGAVDRLNNMRLMGDIPLSNYVEVVPVNSENVAITGTDQVFYNLVIEDLGDSNALAAVQGQYNTKVVRSSRTETESTYTIIGAAGLTLADFTKTKDWKVKGCAVCPTGYSAFEDGYIYSISIEEGTTTIAETISANVEAGSAVLVSTVEGFTTFTVITTQALTEAEIAAFVATNPSAVVELVSSDVAAICSPDNVTTTSWVAGDTCKVQSETYTIILADDECGTSKLASIIANYPEFSAHTLVSQANCQTKYSMVVPTNLVCEGCSDIFRGLFVSEAPVDFEGKPWKKAAKTYSATALMGIKFKAKQIILSGSEVYRDDMPFFATSARLAVAGGLKTTVSQSFIEGTGSRIALTVLSIATQPENWGGNLREFEDITKRYQEGVSRHEGNNYGKWILGEETLLEGTTPYVDYILTVRLNKYAQSFSGELNETYHYHFVAPIGAHVQVENLLNSLAAAASVATVQAYAKDAAPVVTTTTTII